MAKQKAKAAPTASLKATKRSGYKRKSNKRVNVLDAQLSRIKRKAFRRAQYDKSLTFAQPPEKK
jgi:hypothetical protein